MIICHGKTIFFSTRNSLPFLSWLLRQLSNLRRNYHDSPTLIFMTSAKSSGSKNASESKCRVTPYLGIVNHVNSLEDNVLGMFRQKLQNLLNLSLVRKSSKSNAVFSGSRRHELLRNQRDLRHLRQIRDQRRWSIVEHDSVYVHTSVQDLWAVKQQQRKWTTRNIKQHEAIKITTLVIQEWNYSETRRWQTPRLPAVIVVLECIPFSKFFYVEKWLLMMINKSGLKREMFECHRKKNN